MKPILPRQVVLLGVSSLFCVPKIAPGLQVVPVRWTTPVMAKKRTRGTPLKTTIQFTESDIPLFEAAAEREGASSVVDWLLMIGRRRARLMAAPGPIRVSEVLVPVPDDVRVEPKQ